MICRANQWTGFYMVSASVMKELNLLDPAEAAILKYKNHPSLNAIRGKISKLDNANSYFKYTSIDKH